MKPVAGILYGLRNPRRLNLGLVSANDQKVEAFTGKGEIVGIAIKLAIHKDFELAGHPVPIDRRPQHNVIKRRKLRHELFIIIR